MSEPLLSVRGLGKQFSSRTVAVASGLICAVLPRATWAGIEARPYAASMMAAAWLTVLLVRAARRDSSRARTSLSHSPSAASSIGIGLSARASISRPSLTFQRGPFFLARHKAEL